MNLFDTVFQPMLLKEIKDPFDSKDYFFEIKYDGIRVLLFVDKNRVVIRNRYGKDISFKYPELQEIKKLVDKPTIFDGELVIFMNGISSFSAILKRAHLHNKEKIAFLAQESPVTFVAFDLLYEDKDLTSFPFIERRKKLNVYDDTDFFRKSFGIMEKGILFFQKCQALSFEGIVAKNIYSPYYINERSDVWLKIKNWHEDIFFIGGYQQNKKGNSFYLGEYVKNEFCFVGKVSVYQGEEVVKKLVKQKISPFSSFKEKNVCYVKPLKKCLVRYLERSENGLLRQPIFISLKN